MTVRPTLMAGAAAVYGLVAAQALPFTAAAHLAVAVPVVVLVGVAVADRWATGGVDGPAVTIGCDLSTPTARRALRVWVLLLGATAYWQLMVYTGSPRDTYPTFSSLVNIAAGTYPVRAAIWAAWLGLGWYLVRR